MNQSSINLIDSLRLIFPTEDFAWLLESRPRAMMVQWVSLDVKNGQPGDILLLPASKASNQIFKTAAEKGIEVILLLGEIARLKNITSKVPVIVVDTEDEIRQIQRRILTLLSNNDEFLNERKVSIHTQLSRLAAQGVELKELARAMMEISRHGVLIHDKRLAIIAEAPSADLLPFWNDITDQLNRLENLPPQMRDRQQAGDQNIAIRQNLSGGISRVIVPISVGDVARGYLSVIGINDTLDQVDHAVADGGALICAIAMSRTKAVRETEKRLHSDLLTALLQEDISPRDAKLWVDAIGLDQSQAHTALQFSWASSSPPSRRRLETLIHGEVIRMGIKVILNPAGEAVICFCQVSPDEDGYRLALDLGAGVLEKGSREFPDAKIRCGVGSPTTNINLWHKSFREAGLALDMATRLDKDKPLYYPELSIYRLIMLLENNPELRDFQNDVLGSLLAQGGKNNFIETLEAYFEQKGNLTQTAEMLYIHRNTLSYRLDRIAEIAGWDLDNHDTALSVQLALKIYRLMEGSGELRE